MSKSGITFPVRKHPEFIRELREKVQEQLASNNLTRFGNRKMIVKSLFMLTLYLVPYLLMITGAVTHPAALVACWILMGTGIAGVGMAVMHDANHRAYSRNKKVNQWMGYSMFLLGGFPANWQQQHNVMHHGYTNIEGYDEDIDPGGYLRLSPHKPLRKIHRFQHLYAWVLYGLMTLSWVTTKDFRQLNGYRETGVKLTSSLNYRQLLWVLVAAKIFYYGLFLVLPMIVLPVAWYIVVLLFLLMHFTSGLILTTIFQTAHVVTSSDYPRPDETGSMENNWAIHQLFTTSDFAPKNRVLSWLIGGLNYQVEHHLFPNISHVHYRKLAPLVRETAKKYNLPYHVQPTFFHALADHGRMLRRLGREPAVRPT